MPDSIKERILTLLGGDGGDVESAVLGPLKTAGLVRQIRREVDPLAEQKVLPALIVFDGDEIQIESETDTRGRRYHFPIVIRWITDQKGAAYHRARKEIVPLIQQALETDQSLQRLLVTIPSGGEEKPFASLQQPACGADVWYLMDYRRLRGDPFTTY